MPRGRPFQPPLRRCAVSGRVPRQSRPCGEPCGQLLGGDRLAEGEPLREITFLGQQQHHLILGLNPYGDDGIYDSQTSESPCDPVVGPGDHMPGHDRSDRAYANL
jgi:hypothetical protein